MSIFNQIFIFKKLKYLVYRLFKSLRPPYKNIRLQFISRIEETWLIILLSLTHVIEVKALFLGQIFEMQILMDLHVIRTSESGNHFCVCLLVCMCMCVCFQHNPKVYYRKNIKFGILHLYCMQMLLETLGKNFVYRSTQENCNALRPMEGFFCHAVFPYLECKKYNKNDIHFCHA